MQKYLDMTGNNIPNEDINSIEAEKVVPLYKRLGAAGSDISDALGGHVLGKFAVAAVPGLVIMAMIYGLDKISGAYFNPAISIGFTITRHLKSKELPFYIVAQVSGSIIASFVILAVIGQS